MARIMAIDYGTKRTGIAVTDTEQIIATGLTTVYTKDIHTWIKNYLSKENVEGIVIGEPRQANGKPSEIESHIVGFVRWLQKAFPSVEIERTDERFTSLMALMAMRDAGLKKKARKNKALVNQISATIILQSYLEKNNK